MKHKKSLALFLTLMLLLAPLTGCASQETETNSDTTPTVNPETDGESGEETAPPETESTIDTDDLPADLNYDGYTFRFLTWNGGNVTDTQWPNWLVVEDTTGEPVNDAAFRRNAKVAERLNVEFSCTEGDTNYTAPFLKQAVLSNTDIADLAVFNTLDTMGDLITENCLYDANKIKYMDFSKSYYSADATSTYSILGKQYIFTGEFPYLAPPSVFMIFNADEWEKLRLEDPYTLVREGTWTHDKFVELITDSYVDTNANGEADYDDFYGFFAGVNAYQFFFYSYGVNGITVDGEDYELNYYSDKAVDVLDKIVALRNSPDTWNSDTIDWPHFWNGHDLICWYTSSIYRLRDIEFNFGILPVPKFTETDERYLTFQVPIMSAIPSNITDPDRVGAIVEALFSTSAIDMTDAMINRLVEYQVVPNTDSQEMMRLMMNNPVYDFTRFINVCGPSVNGFALYRDLVNNGSTDLASAWNSAKKSANKSFQNFIKSVSELP